MYRIEDWEDTYENSRSISIKDCNWVALPNKQDGLGYNRLVATHGNGVAHYGVFIALVCICSKQRMPRNGYLTDNGKKDGRPLDVVDISLMTAMPEDVIQEALDRLSNPDIGWISRRDGNGIATTSPHDAGSLPPKERKKEGNGKKEIASTEVDTTLLEISSWFHEQQRKRFPKESALKDLEKVNLAGAVELGKLIRLDNWMVMDIKVVLEFVMKDDFWGKQIRSLRGIRTKSKNGNMKIENARAAMPQDDGGSNRADIEKQHSDKQTKEYREWAKDAASPEETHEHIGNILKKFPTQEAE